MVMSARIIGNNWWSLDLFLLGGPGQIEMRNFFTAVHGLGPRDEPAPTLRRLGS